jgi:membrane protease YdiL (CAAX protease family)
MKKIYLISELVALFVFLPVILYLDIPLSLKIASVSAGFLYSIWVLLRSGLLNSKTLFFINLQKFIKTILFRFLVVVIITTAVIYFTDPGNLFIVVRKAPLMWIGFTFIYALLSVYPQELIYRTFFFFRYENLFRHTITLIVLNAIFFSLAHVVFLNWRVLIITFVGGLLFATTFLKSRSLMVTSIEHALYGSWLFTVGMGGMLAFPMP